MLEFITDHYLIIMIVSLFLIFALIGYIIDSVRNKKRGEETEQFLEAGEEIPKAVTEVESAEEIPVEPEENNDLKEEVVVIEEEPVEEKKEIKSDETLIPEVDEPEDNN